ncbi:MAG: hypothetical protein LJE66_13045 [Desulfobacterales bacterium]|jgi:hypothetical protein|nr:hypothetical protein [Desulfobacterales bacterium]
MIRKPNPLLIEFLDKNIPLPSIDWETVPLGVNPMDAWEMYDETVEGWVPVWFPTIDRNSGRSYGEFERAQLFNDDLERILKAMNRWPLWGSPQQKKYAAAFALLQLFCETKALCTLV